MILICDHKLLIFNLLLIMSVWACEMKEILNFMAHEGGKAEIWCPYESGYETYNKYLCRGECPLLNKDILVESGSAAEDRRFSLTDDRTIHIFTVTITDLRTDDEGQYWCAVRTGILKTDLYTEIHLEIKPVQSERKSSKPNSAASDHSTEPASEDGGSLSLPSSSSSSVTSLSQLQLAIIFMLPVMGILMVFGLSSFIYFRVRQKKEGVQWSGVTHVSAENLLTEDATYTICHYEEIICSDNRPGFSLGLPVFGEHDASETLYSTVLFQTTDHSDRTSAGQDC